MILEILVPLAKNLKSKKYFWCLLLCCALLIGGLAQAANQFDFHRDCAERGKFSCQYLANKAGHFFLFKNDYDKALVFYDTAERAGSQTAPFFIGWVHEEKARAVLNSLAQGKYAQDLQTAKRTMQSQYHLAAQAYLRAISNDFAPAYNNLAILLMEGLVDKSVSGDQSQLDLLRYAANKQNPVAIINLVLYFPYATDLNHAKIEQSPSGIVRFSVPLKNINGSFDVSNLTKTRLGSPHRSRIKWWGLKLRSLQGKDFVITKGPVGSLKKD